MIVAPIASGLSTNCNSIACNGHMPRSQEPVVSIAGMHAAAETVNSSVCHEKSCSLFPDRAEARAGPLLAIFGLGVFKQ